MKLTAEEKRAKRQAAKAARRISFVTYPTVEFVGIPLDPPWYPNPPEEVLFVRDSEVTVSH